VIGAMIFVGSLTSQRLDFGLAHDEDLSATRAIVGEYIVTEDGRVPTAYVKKPSKSQAHHYGMDGAESAATIA
jgi:hypothetical protein